MRSKTKIFTKLISFMLAIMDIPIKNAVKKSDGVRNAAISSSFSSMITFAWDRFYNYNPLENRYQEKEVLIYK